ncbi:uncharacterized protein N0V96_001457 [Colletotrichum fioriniae]|uniref:uncharacterized protein n=1 Tax=Colletotrichum fioriniae TaxID=710243 RepID=UPI0032DAC013|nr:hypothetical protein N0V96_001457 [Colletotrichum fioriniae]
MDGEKKAHEVNSATSTASDVGVGVHEDAPQNVSWGRKVLYHLWDADQHLKSPQRSDRYAVCYTIAFAIMQIPSNLIALKIRPRYCIVFCELGWTAFTFAQAAAQSSNHMYAFRFMIGLFESGFSPIIIFLLGSWYTKPELAKRVAIWHITGFFGQATSGFLQAGIHKSLNGHLGMAGWRWMYIEDKQIAMQRAAKQGKAEITGVVDLKLLKRMFGNWRWWILCLMYIFYGNSCQANNYFAIYLRTTSPAKILMFIQRENGYSVTQRNVIPACANLVTMATDFAWGFMSDLTGNRPLWIIGPLMGTTVVGSSILTAYPPTDAARVAGFFLVSCGYVTAVTWTWANEVNNGNAEERALTISSMNGLFYATNSFLPILIFPQTMAPTFERGFPSILSFALAAVVLVLIADFLHKRQLRREAHAAGEQPTSETVVEGKADKKEKEMEGRLSGAIEPVRNSSSII